MDYRILLQEENDAVRERYELSMERIRSMDTEEMGLPYGCYFKKVSAFIRRIERLAKRVEETGLSGEDGLEAVSYTHLDVYKRQGLRCPAAVHGQESLWSRVL